MPSTLSYPGVYIEELSSGVRTIAGVATSIATFVGWAPQGPTDRAVRVLNFADYVRTYGEIHARSYLGYSVRQFFDNGGSDAYVLRIANAADDKSFMGWPSRSMLRFTVLPWHRRRYAITVGLREKCVCRKAPT